MNIEIKPQPVRVTFTIKDVVSHNGETLRLTALIEVLKKDVIGDNLATIDNVIKVDKIIEIQTKVDSDMMKTVIDAINTKDVTKEFEFIGVVAYNSDAKLQIMVDTANAVVDPS